MNGDVVGHEVYGQLDPFRRGTKCPDENGCSIQRESQIRAQMGRPERTYSHQLQKP